MEDFPVSCVPEEVEECLTGIAQGPRQWTGGSPPGLGGTGMAFLPNRMNTETPTPQTVFWAPRRCTTFGWAEIGVVGIQTLSRHKNIGLPCSQYAFSKFVPRR